MFLMLGYKILYNVWKGLYFSLTLCIQPLDGAVQGNIGVQLEVFVQLNPLSPQMACKQNIFYI